MECTGFDDLTGEANLNQLDENQNLDFKKEADIICKVIDGRPHQAGPADESEPYR